MRLIIAVFLFFAVQNNYAQQKADPKAEGFLDFWIGKWDVQWDEGGETGSGTNSLTWVLDEKVVQENFIVKEGQMTGYRGMSHSVFSQRDSLWRQTWVDNQGGYLEFDAIEKDGNPGFIQVYQTKTGNDIQNRMLFIDINKDQFTWLWETSKDAGKTWHSNWTIEYSRKKD